MQLLRYYHLVFLFLPIFSQLATAAVYTSISRNVSNPSNDWQCGFDAMCPIGRFCSYTATPFPSISFLNFDYYGKLPYSYTVLQEWNISMTIARATNVYLVFAGFADTLG